ELPVLVVDRLVEAEEVVGVLDLVSGARLAAGDPARVGGDDVEEDVADDGDGEEEDDRPENPSDQVVDHSLALLPVPGSRMLLNGLCFGERGAGPERPAPRSLHSNASRVAYFKRNVFRSALALAGWKRYPPVRC